MKLGEVIEFRKDLFFEGAVQADWFYNPEKSSRVAENFAFHGKEYYGVEDQSIARTKRIDTISLIENLAEKFDSPNSNPLTLAIADYGTGKSHLAVTLAHLLSGPSYLEKTYNKIISNITNINKEDGEKVKQLYGTKNLVLMINGMKDFNLHSEILRAAQRSLQLYGLSDESLRKINRTLQTAQVFFERNMSSISLFEEAAKKYEWSETGDSLIQKINSLLLTDETAFNIVNSVYEKINGQEIQWDQGISAGNILEKLVAEYCGMNGTFEHIVILFDEFGRFLEYASGANSAKSGDSALQQIFEAAQNAEGAIQIVNFIQSDINTYLQRVDQTSNISRYIGRYQASDKYHISSNLETVFANLIQRKDKDIFDKEIVQWQISTEERWDDAFEKINKWLITKGLWKDREKFKKTIVEGIYPMHPLSTYMLTQLSDYLQNRTSLTYVSQYIESLSEIDIETQKPLIMPEYVMQGDLFNEMLKAEESGRQASQQCILYNAILKKTGSKLSENALIVLRSNLILRLLRFKTENYEDTKEALAFCSGLSLIDIDEALNILENEYAVLGYDEYAKCFDFMEDASGLHDYKILKNRALKEIDIKPQYLEDVQIRSIFEIDEPIDTNFATTHKISTTDWQYQQYLFPIDSFTAARAQSIEIEWEQAVTSVKPKGQIIWLYINKDYEPEAITNVQKMLFGFEKKPILVMLLNDKDNSLINCLKEYYFLIHLDTEKKNKFQKYYQDDLIQTIDNLKSIYDRLQKERNYISPEGVKQLSSRLSVELTRIFESIYPNTVPFVFDSFVTKNNNLGGKGSTYYCTIIRMLLSDSVSHDNIHNFQSDIRNRIESLLLDTSSNSWRCINEAYKMTPPENKRIRYIYDEITQELSNSKQFRLKELFNKYSLPPYGMSEDIIVLLISVICANLSYCLRIQINKELQSISNWKDKVVIKDKKIDLELIKNSILIQIDAGAVEGKFIKLFEEIESNKDLSIIGTLEKQLHDLLQVDELPESLETRKILAEKILSEGRKIQNKWDETIQKIDDNLERASLYTDIPKAIDAIDIASRLKLERHELFEKYEFTDDYKEELQSLDENVRNFLKENFSTWLTNKLHCQSITSMKSFENFCKTLSEKLENGGLTQYSLMVQKHKDNELKNKEAILERQTLNTDLTNFVQNAHYSKYTQYTTILDLLKTARALEERVVKYTDGFDYDTERNVKKLKKQIEELQEIKTAVEDEISSIYNSLAEIDNYGALIKIRNDILNVLDKRIRKEDADDLKETYSNLNELIDDVSRIHQSKNSRKIYEQLVKSIPGKYEDKEFDFDVNSLLQNEFQKVENEINQFENSWKSSNLVLTDRDRRTLLKAKDNLDRLPDYLSEETIAEADKFKQEIDDMLSEQNIDIVIDYFERLTDEEKEKCYQEITKILKQ